MFVQMREPSVRSGEVLVPPLRAIRVPAIGLDEVNRPAIAMVEIHQDTAHGGIVGEVAAGQRRVAGRFIDSRLPLTGFQQQRGERRNGLSPFLLSGPSLRLPHNRATLPHATGGRCYRRKTSAPDYQRTCRKSRRANGEAKQELATKSSEKAATRYSIRYSAFSRGCASALSD
jgi:hypothetical protein